MTPLYIFLNTGNEELDEAIIQHLSVPLMGYGLYFTPEQPSSHILVLAPQFIKELDMGRPILALSDSSATLHLHDSVVNYTPMPVTEDDLLRLEYRIIAIGNDLR
jgi:hypothetical protein